MICMIGFQKIKRITVQITVFCLNYDLCDYYDFMIEIFGSVSECMLLLYGVFEPYISLYEAVVHIILLRKTDGFTT